MAEIYSQTLATGFSPESWYTQGLTLVERILGAPGGQWFWENFSDNLPPQRFDARWIEYSAVKNELVSNDQAGCLDQILPGLQIFDVLREIAPKMVPTELPESAECIGRNDVDQRCGQGSPGFGLEPTFTPLEVGILKGAKRGGAIHEEAEPL